jgi:hypothetical protein
MLSKKIARKIPMALIATSWLMAPEAPTPTAIVAKVEVGTSSD